MRTTYEIMTPKMVGLTKSLAGAGQAFRPPCLPHKLEELGYRARRPGAERRLRALQGARRPQEACHDEDIEALVTDELREDIAGYSLEWFEVESSSRRSPHAKVGVTLPDGSSVIGSFVGDGPIDAIFQAINAATATGPVLSEFTIGAVTEGQDALGEASVVLELDGATGAGQGVSTDIIDAAARAYVRALSVARARSQASDAVGLPEPATG